MNLEWLYFKVSLLAGALVNLGVEKGDRILIYMPLIPEAIISMLAVVRIGAVHSVVFGGKLAWWPKRLMSQIKELSLVSERLFHQLSIKTIEISLSNSNEKLQS